MQNSQWQSLRWIHRLYRRHVIQRFVRAAVLSVGLLVLAFQLLFYASTLFQLEFGGINFLFTVLAGLWLWFLIDYSIDWGREGFRIRTFFHNWEREHPDIANRASMLVYAEKQAEEIERLGYSKELIQADDRWLDTFIGDYAKQKKSILPIGLAVIFLAVTIPSFVLWSAKRDFMKEGLQRINQALWTSPEPLDETKITVPDAVSVARGKSVVLTANWSHPKTDEIVSIHFRSRSDWNQQSVRREGRQLIFHVPAVNREMEYYFSAGNKLSNKGRIIPIDPPSIVSGEILVTPPAYTGLPKQKIDRLRPLAVPEGSDMVITADASIDLVSASLYYGNQSIPVAAQNKKIQSDIKIQQSGDLFFVMEDENGLTGRSRRYRVTSIPDATPALDIYQPKQVSNLPSNMQMKVHLYAHDDYRLERLYKHVTINGEQSDNYTFMVWENTPVEAASADQTSVTTELYITYDWNMAEYNLFPGDKVTFWLELFDNDALHGPKSVRSKTFTVNYPSLVDLLSQLDKFEEEKVEELDQLVEKQKQISEDAKKTIEKIAEKIEERKKGAEGSEQETWMEEKELESIKERQEELIEEAKKIEEQLEEYQQNAEEAAQQEEQSGFTPETLEKIEKIRELMEELMDRDSRALMEQIDQTIEDMANQINDQQLEDLQFSFEDYNQQLERTLSMLESAFQERQLEGLQQMADDLAQRQDHLQRETDKLAGEMEQLEQERQNGDSEELAKKQQDLETQKNILESRQEQMEEDAQSLMDAMKKAQEAMKEENPDIAKKLEQMREEAEEAGMKSEMSKASENMKTGNMKRAQENQKKAVQSLQSLSQQLQEQMSNMGGMDMQKDMQDVARLVRQGLFLSIQMEGLTESALGRSDDLDALRRAQAFQRELHRIDAKWSQIAQKNPFMNRDVEIELRNSNKKLSHAISAGQGEKWVGLHETRGSMISLNNAIKQMKTDMEDMQQQMSQSQASGMMQQMQQMISQQRSMQQMLEQMRQMGGQNEQMMQQLQKMAEQQAKIRKEIEKMMQQYRHAQHLKNQLEGIYQEMKDVENLLKEGVNDERVEEKQKKIMTRMLEAGSMQEEDDFGKDREEEVAKTGLDADSPENTEPVTVPDKIDRFVERPETESIPLPYREALKRYYIRLSEGAMQ